MHAAKAHRAPSGSTSRTCASCSRSCTISSSFCANRSSMRRTYSTVPTADLSRSLTSRISLFTKSIIDWICERCAATSSASSRGEAARAPSSPSASASPAPARVPGEPDELSGSFLDSPADDGATTSAPSSDVTGESRPSEASSPTPAPSATPLASVALPPPSASAPPPARCPRRPSASREAPPGASARGAPSRVSPVAPPAVATSLAEPAVAPCPSLLRRACRNRRPAAAPSSYSKLSVDAESSPSEYSPPSS
mmetsp:Transcript_8952/g.31596  ORF Transcript_8952/g.31596 Transcript_8952/m.31596 type:complete len:254 (-) Transcript_8952:1230-1991(-)